MKGDKRITFVTLDPDKFVPALAAYVGILQTFERPTKVTFFPDTAAADRQDTSLWRIRLEFAGMILWISQAHGFALELDGETRIRSFDSISYWYNGANITGALATDGAVELPRYALEYHTE